MLNSAVESWVKNVYRVCIEGVVTRVNSYTSRPILTSIQQETGVQTTIINTITNSFTPYSYTAFFQKIPLLFDRLYTFSTVPITTTFNEKIRKDS